MKSVRAAAIVILGVIGAALMGVPASAQQPTAASTPTVPNPNWCPGVPLSARPPQVRAEVWTKVWNRCMNLPGVAEDYTCGHYCKGALEMQWRARMHAEGHTAEQPPEWPAPTDKLQGGREQRTQRNDVPSSIGSPCVNARNHTDPRTLSVVSRGRGSPTLRAVLRPIHFQGKDC